MSEPIQIPPLFEPCTHCRPHREHILALCNLRNNDMKDPAVKLWVRVGTEEYDRQDVLEPERLNICCRWCSSTGKVLTPAGKAIAELLRFYKVTAAQEEHHEVGF